MNDNRSYSRKRRRDELDDVVGQKSYDGFMDDESEPHKFGTAVLPVANLSDSFDGVPKDGMEYLFTVRREEKRLPIVIRVNNPYSAKDSIRAESSPHREDSGFSKARSAMPTQEWRECFEERFRNFRANSHQPTIHISLPKSPTSDSRVPDMRERDRWWAFFRGDINWERVPSSQFHTKRYDTGDRRRRQTVDYDEELSKNEEKMRGWAVYDEPLSWDHMDEVPKAHDVPEPSQWGDIESPRENAQQSERASSPEGTSKGVVVESALPTPRDSASPQIAVAFDPAMSGKPREPTAELLDLLDQRVTFHLLKFFIRWIQGHFDRSSLPPPPLIYDDHTQTNSSEKRVYDLTPTHARWMFALLSRLDAQLTSGEISVLRQLAREVMRVLKEQITNEEALPRTDSAPPMGQAACWMIVAAIAGIWGQRDLWMDAEEALR